MPVTLSKIASNTASVTLEVGEDTVTIVYFPARMTEKVFSQLQAMSGTDEKNIHEHFDGFNQAIISMVKSWDVFEDDKEKVMFPLDKDRLGELPIFFRMQVIETIMNDIRPNELVPQTES
jgi:hypothetical protein